MRSRPDRLPVVVTRQTGAPPGNFPPSQPPVSLYARTLSIVMAWMSGVARRSWVGLQGGSLVAGITGVVA